MATTPASPKHFLVASDFDQTLSFNDSGAVLSELIGASRFQEKVDGLARSNMVHQGGELAYLIRHDPEFRGVRREHLEETGRRVRLRSNLPALVDLLERGVDGHRFSFFVISAAPREVIQSALAGVVAAGPHLWHRARVRRPHGRSALRLACPAGYGKVAVVEELEDRLGIGPDRTIYVGDGSSDVHVMLHVNNRDGFHDCGLREQAAGAHREEHAAQRRRVERDGADSREGARVGNERYPVALRIERPDAARVGEGTRGPGHRPGVRRTVETLWPRRQWSQTGAM